MSLPEQPPAGRANSVSAVVNRLRPVHSSPQLPPSWYPPLAPILECASTVGAGPPIQGSVPTWGGTSYPGAWLTTLGAGPPTCGGGVAIRATCPLPRGEAACSDLSRGRGFYFYVLVRSGGGAGSGSRCAQRDRPEEQGFTWGLVLRDAQENLAACLPSSYLPAEQLSLHKLVSSHVLGILGLNALGRRS